MNDVVDCYFCGVIDGNSVVGEFKIQGQTFPAISGRYGQGALPVGRYELSACYPLKPVPGKTEPYQGDVVPWVAKITPLFDTNRTKLLIHPDGGVEGTRGCIGISKNDEVCRNLIDELLIQKNKLILEVSVNE